MATQSVNFKSKSDAYPRAPVPHMGAQGIKNQDPLSKRIRKLDNTDLIQATGSGVYISTNETGTATIRKIMETIPIVTQGCHIGFSGWHNFDIMVIRKSSQGIICDYNPENACFLHHILELVRNSKNRADFVKQAAQHVEKTDFCHLLATKGDLTYAIDFIPNISEDPLYANVAFIQDEIGVELNKPGSWLQTEEGFRHIQKLSLEDKIVILTEDIRNTVTFQKMAKILHDNDIPIDSLYVSNIHHYVSDQAPGAEDGKQSFVQTITALSEGSTIVIAADSRYLFGALAQQLMQPKTTPNVMEWFFPTKTSSIESKLAKLNIQG